MRWYVPVLGIAGICGVGHAVAQDVNFQLSPDIMLDLQQQPQGGYFGTVEEQTLGDAITKFEVKGTDLGAGYDLQFIDPQTSAVVADGKFDAITVNVGTPFEASTLVPLDRKSIDPTLGWMFDRSVMNIAGVDRKFDISLDDLKNYGLPVRPVEGQSAQIKALVASLALSDQIQFAEVKDGTTLRMVALAAPGFERVLENAAFAQGVTIGAVAMEPGAGAAGAQLQAPVGAVLDATWPFIQLQPNVGQRLLDAVNPPLRAQLEPSGYGCLYTLEVRGRVEDFNVVRADSKNWHYKVYFTVQVSANPDRTQDADMLMIMPGKVFAVFDTRAETDKAFDEKEQLDDRDMAVREAVQAMIVRAFRVKFSASIVSGG